MYNKHCSECGESFTCDIEQGKATCWCFDLPNVIPLESITTNTDTSQDCLCPTCLQSKIDPNTPPT